MTHAGMRDYYCRNFKKVLSRYKANWGGFIVRVKQFYARNSAPGSQLEFTEEDAVKLELKISPPLFCGP